MSVQRKTGAWINERLGLSALAYPVPEHANGLLYTLGGITLVGFLVLFLTGIYLAQFYHPHPSDVRPSIIYVVTQVPLGDFVRGIHHWTANLVVVTVSLHLLRVFFSGAYKAPRELNWLVGVGLLAVTMGFIFTGTVVKWDQEGLEALVHNQAVARILGSLGGWFSSDFTISVPPLIRVYFAHVAILPALFTALMAAHIFLVKVHGMAPLGRADDLAIGPAARSDLAARYGEPLHPFTSHVRMIAGWGLLLTSLGMAWAIGFPPPVGPPPVGGIEITKPPFMFWWLYAAEDFLGIRGLLIIPAVFFFMLAAVPFLDRGRFHAMRKRRGILGLGIAVILVLVVLSLFTGFTPPVAHTRMGR